MNEYKQSLNECIQTMKMDVTSFWVRFSQTLLSPQDLSSGYNFSAEILKKLNQVSVQ